MVSEFKDSEGWRFGGGSDSGREAIWTLVETSFSQSHVRISHKN